jgi:hypothetical protein
MFACSDAEEADLGFVRGAARKRTIGEKSGLRPFKRLKKGCLVVSVVLVVGTYRSGFTRLFICTRAENGSGQRAGTVCSVLRQRSVRSSRTLVRPSPFMVR